MDYQWYAGDEEIESIGRDDRFKSLIADFVNRNVVAALKQCASDPVSLENIDGKIHAAWIGPDIDGKPVISTKELYRLLTQPFIDTDFPEDREFALQLISILERAAAAIKGSLPPGD